jgi:hypothetical protein
MVECCKCAALYAVTAVAALIIDPKCHYCRQARRRINRDVVLPPTPTVQCGTCLNKYVCPTVHSDAWMKFFQCGGCTAKKKGVVQENLTLIKLVEQNSMLLSRAVGLPTTLCAAVVMPGGAGSLFKMFCANEAEFGAWRLPSEPGEGSATATTACRSSSPSHSAPACMEQDGQELLVMRKGKVIHAGALHSVYDTIAHSSLYDMCNLCCETLPLDQLFSACGACENLTCGDCLGTWYGQVKVGELVQLSRLTCPFCKRSPHGATLMRYNRPACAIKRSASTVIANRADFYFGWCVSCYKVRVDVCVRREMEFLSEFGLFLRCQIHSTLRLYLLLLSGMGISYVVYFHHHIFVHTCTYMP